MKLNNQERDRIRHALLLYVERMDNNVREMEKVEAALDSGERVSLFAPGEEGKRAATSIKGEFVRSGAEALDLLRRFEDADDE